MKQQDKIIITIILAAFIITGFILLAIVISKPTQSISGKVIEAINKEEIGPTEPAKPSDLEYFVVTKVIDGDTAIINGESTRLLGIDADERGYPCYKEAKQRIEELILNKEVGLEKDGEDKDQYQRYLRYIFLNGKNINLQLVEEGLAVARFFPKNKKYKEEILAAEIKARKNKIGCKWREEEKEKEESEEEDEKEEPEPESEPEKQDIDYECSQNVYNCGNFSTHAQAQEVYEFCGGLNNDIHRLDRDADGFACEALP